MRLALSICNGRISPVFDVARQLWVLELAGKQIVRDREEQLEESVVGKVAQLAGVELLICGAISWPLARLLAAQQIRVIPFIAGPAVEVLRAFLEDRLNRPRFAMPGCCGHGLGPGAGLGRRCRQRRGQSHPPFEEAPR